MVTKEEAMAADSFHYGNCVRVTGTRGGITETVERWRRNGRTKTWKRDASRFRVPIKFGLYHYGEITETNAHLFHTAENCPLTWNR